MDQILISNVFFPDSAGTGMFQVCYFVDGVKTNLPPAFSAIFVDGVNVAAGFLDIVGADGITCRLFTFPADENTQQVLFSGSYSATLNASETIVRPEICPDPDGPASIKQIEELLSAALEKRSVYRIVKKCKNHDVFGCEEDECQSGCECKSNCGC